VYVHEIGAPHMVDPSKLLESAGRLYGDDMERLWGEVAAVPEERLRTLKGGEQTEGFKVAYTPGHASHHVSFLHVDTGNAFVGDVAGVRIPPFEHTLAPTPPPDIDVELWLDSIETIAKWNPLGLCLTHFGRVTDVEDQLRRLRSAIAEQADMARRGGEEDYVRATDRALRDATDAEAAERYVQAAPPEQLFLGLERYWRKRAETAIA
jgi:glyoxylase-like metal-dependent hydrolase (beta-lactamase superfamily II)